MSQSSRIRQTWCAWLGSISGERPASGIWAGLFLVVFVLRGAFLAAKGSLIYSPDSDNYVRIVREFSQGSFAAVREYPFHSFFPLTLLPAYLLPEHFIPIAVGAQLAAVSSMTTVVAFAIAHRLFGGKVAWATWAFLAILHLPTWLWLPYVLSEPNFLLLLATLTLCFVRYRQNPSREKFLIMLAVAVLMTVARPTGVIVFPAIVSVCAFTILRERRGWSVWTSAAFLSALLVLSAGGLLGVAYRSERIQRALMRDYNNSSLLFLAAFVDSTSFKTHIESHDTKLKLLAQGGPFASVADEREFISRVSIHKILGDKAWYARACVKRYVSYWLPASYQESWSWSHALSDIALALFFVLPTFGWFFAGGLSATELGIFLMANSFALLSAFSNSDTDGRLRLPGELLLIILSVGLWRRAVARIQASRLVQQNSYSRRVTTSESM